MNLFGVGSDADVANARATQQNTAARDMENMFGGRNHPGFFGGGYFDPNQGQYSLPGFGTMQETYQDLAMRAQGLTPQYVTSQGVDPSQARLLAATGFRGGPQATQTTHIGGWQQGAPGTQPQEQFRGQQQQLADQLFGTISGNTPSVAQEQLKQNTQSNIANAYALAQSGRYNPGAARMAATNAGNINQQSAGNAALLRAQEIQGAQGMLGGVLGGARGQDIGNFQAQNAATQGYLGQNLQAAGMQQQGQIAGQQAAFNAFQNSQQNQLGSKVLGAAAGIGAGMMGIPGLGGGGGGGAAPSPSMGSGPGPWAGGYGAPTQGYSMGPTGIGGYAPYSKGGMVPGYAQGGDSEGNDTVPAMLSPREVVLPRSVTLAENAPERAKAFMEEVRKKRSGLKRAA